MAAFFLALDRFPPAGGRAETEVRDEHHVCGHAAHRVYLGVHGSSRRGYNLGPGLPDRQVQETEGGSGKTE